MKKFFIILCILAILALIQLLNRDFFTTYNNVEYSNKLTIKDIKDLKKGQKIMTNMLREFDRICRKHKLEYWCIGGTLIGIIRNKGWIPHDGDIDVAMRKTDYKKLRKIIQKELPEGMWFQDSTTDKFYTSNIGKIRDLNSNYKDYKPRDWHNGLQLDIFLTNDNKDNDTLSWGEGTFKKNDIFPLKEKMFEDIKVFINNNYDLVLTNIFGKDYMKQVPVDKRIPHEGRVDPYHAPKWMKDKYPELYK
jgi:phosphorylcholine metabolism protein LicD